jgi:hypothetical protein
LYSSPDVAVVEPGTECFRPLFPFVDGLAVMMNSFRKLMLVQ